VNTAADHDDDRDPYAAPGTCWRCHGRLDPLWSEHGSHPSCDEAAEAARAASTANPPRRPRHGGSDSGAYRSWRSMKARCLNPRHPYWSRYGGRGIAIDPAWRDCFECFLRDVGPRPPGTSLDRIDNDGPYTAVNVRWATAEVQARNRGKRITT